MFSSLILLHLTFASMASAHEESCRFEVKLSKVKYEEKRTPQQIGALVKADISVLKARSIPDTISYLDCKHWENEILNDISLSVPDKLVVSAIGGKPIKIEFRSRNSPNGLQTTFKVIE